MRLFEIQINLRQQTVIRQERFLSVETNETTIRTPRSRRLSITDEMKILKLKQKSRFNTLGPVRLESTHIMVSYLFASSRFCLFLRPSYGLPSDDTVVLSAYHNIVVRGSRLRPVSPNSVRFRIVVFRERAGTGGESVCVCV